jgi:hypothetical protein
VTIASGINQRRESVLRRRRRRRQNANRRTRVNSLSRSAAAAANARTISRKVINFKVRKSRDKQIKWHFQN